MKVLLVYHFQGNFSMVGMEPLGAIQLGKLLKDRGHQVRYAVMEKRPLERALREFAPELIAYSISSVHHRRALRLNRELKKAHRFYAVFGGPHPTFFPEIIAEEGVDAVCVGEGDLSFPDFVDRLSADQAHTEVANMWVKLDSGELKKNPPAELVADLDTLPYPDREGLYADRWLKDYRMKTFIASRGCPFACAYCYNRLYRDLYQGKGRVWRFRSPQHLVGEIEWVKKNWPLAQLTFVDDVFVPGKEWLVAFHEEYRRRVNLPFTCFLRLDRVDDEQARLLAEAGCRWVFAAIESGEPRIRRELMGRQMSNEQIVAGCEALHRRGIKVFTQNMLGVPGETLDDAFKTLDLNCQCRSDLAITSLFAPFPNLELSRRAIAEGYYSGDPADMPHNMTSRSALKLPQKKELENLQKLLPLFVDLPWLRKHARALIRWPLHPLYSSLRNLWMSVKVFRELTFRLSLREDLAMIFRGVKYIVRDR